MLYKLGDNDPKSSRPRRWREVPLIPLRDIIVFPHMVVPLFVGRERSVIALEESMKKDKDILLVAQKNAKINDPKPDDIFLVGTISTILQLLRLPDGTVKVLVEGKKRARIHKFVSNEEYLMAQVEEIDPAPVEGPDIEALMRGVVATFESYVKVNPKIPPDMLVSISSVDDPSRLVDTIVTHLNLKLEEKQKILEIEEVLPRLEKIYGMLQSELEILQLEKKIRARVKKQMEKTQKEYYLNEQMKAIQKELGEKDEFKGEIYELEEKLKKKKMPEEAQKKAQAEIRKLKMMSPMSAEATVGRNYVDWILALPWDEGTDVKVDLKEAEKVLDEDHYGLKQVKERVVEYLAVQTLVKKMKGPILCFVGPPGVGKTSLARSIARATGRKFVRVSLGGVRDEAEIRGHRRTYIGALPGKIIQGMKKAGSKNPVYLLDEVDKMSMDFRGDPSAALLEVLDPEQNYMFQDHYLDLDYDLSEVMFITTANTLDPIPGPLKDRMEVIRIAGYTEDEKLNIAEQFLVPKQIEAHGLQKKNIEFTKSALLTVIRRYTREAGVRNLEREIASISRKVAKKIVRDGGKEHRVRITGSSVPKYLGIPKYRYGKKEEKDQVGLTTGLAWTQVGGELLPTEVTVMPGKGKLIVTGKLGDVMQESAQAALSYVRSRAEVFGLDKDFYQKVDIHIHIPEGAIPKDGPSAGITMATSIASALLKVPVKRDLAMTGEITLRGNVLPIGGLKEKLLAAHLGEISTVLIPKENEKDLQEIPQKILSALKVVCVGHMDEVLEHALVIDDARKIWKKVKPSAPAKDEEGEEPTYPLPPEERTPISH